MITACRIGGHGGQETQSIALLYKINVGTTGRPLEGFSMEPSPWCLDKWVKASVDGLGEGKDVMNAPGPGAGKEL